MDVRAVEDLRRLAERDDELCRRSELLRTTDEQVASIRMRAESIEAFLAGVVEERARRTTELALAGEELAGRREALARAEALLGEQDDDVGRAQAERTRDRAADHVSVALARLGRCEAALDELSRDARELPGELRELYGRAAAIAGVDGPAASSLPSWASRAHAQLFVSAGQTATERERVIREANELASMLLGEATHGSTVEQVLARVEGSR